MAETLSEEAGAYGSHTKRREAGPAYDGETLYREEIYDFSLVLGGPTFQFFRKARLSGDHLELLLRRLIIITSIAWVPLLLLDRLGSQAASIGRLPFFIMLRCRHDFWLPSRCSSEPS